MKNSFTAHIHHVWPAPLITSMAPASPAAKCTFRCVTSARLSDGSKNLALSLLQASDWFNDALLHRLQTKGWPDLTHSHALVLAHLDPAGTRPAELARRLGITRQSTQKLVQTLVELDVLEVIVDTDDARATVARLSGGGRALAKVVSKELRMMERELARRIGDANIDALRNSLALPWGESPFA